MSDPHDEAADHLLDHLLQQELGARRPPDLAMRIAAASADELDAAAARLDTAASLPSAGCRASTARSTRGRWLLAAAATLACAVGAGWWLDATSSSVPLTGSGPLTGSEPLTGSVRLDGTAQRPLPALAQQLLDAFHAAMPTTPLELRDAARRREVAPQAIPVIRQILALHAEHPDEAVFGARIVEFEFYGAVLGDQPLLQALRQRAEQGEAIAHAELLALTITTNGAEPRAAALQALAAAMPQLQLLEGSVVRWLDTADLSVAEATTIATALHDEALRQLLLRSAELAAAGPRRLIGEPLELVGRLVDDRPFRTGSLRGRDVLVCFWASWCAPSLAALDELRTVQRLHPDLAVVGVSCDHDLASLRNCLAEHGTPGQLHFFDRNRPGWHELASACGVRTVPLTLLLDGDGVVREVVNGARLLPAIERTFGR